MASSLVSRGDGFVKQEVPVSVIRVLLYSVSLLVSQGGFPISVPSLIFPGPVELKEGDVELNTEGLDGLEWLIVVLSGSKTAVFGPVTETETGKGAKEHRVTIQDT